MRGLLKGVQPNAVVCQLFWNSVKPSLSSGDERISMCTYRVRTYFAPIVGHVPKSNFRKSLKNPRDNGLSGRAPESSMANPSKGSRMPW